MRYSCNEIKYYLESRDALIEDESDFINHIENCAECGRLASLTPELEESLVVSNPKTSPLSFEKDILSRIREIEKEMAKGRLWEKALILILLFASVIPVLLTWRFWNEIASLFKTLDITGIFSWVGSIISQVSMPKFDLAGLANAAANSPMIILSLIAITALLWTFSIIEARNALR